MSRRIAAVGRLLLAGCLMLAVHSPVQAESAPFLLGVSGHLLHNGRTLDRPLALLQQAGVRSLRDDAHWAFVERKRDRLRIEPHWYRYLDRLEHYELEAMLILGYGNVFHGKGKKPRTDADRAAYVRYVDHLAKTLSGQVQAWELWNEWDVEAPDDPDFSLDYARLIAEAAPRIREHAPQSLILAGAVTTRGIESGFAHRLIEHGVLQAVDGLSLHPYVHCRRGRSTPEHWIAWMRETSASLDRLAGAAVPLYLTEMAWPAHKGSCGIDEKQQAAYLARSYLLARTLPTIKGMWWYDLHNDGTNPREREHHFGLLDYQLNEKPAYRTLASIGRIVGTYHYLGPEPSPDREVVLLRFANTRLQLVAGWSTGGPRQVTLSSASAPGPRVQLIDTETPENGLADSGVPWQCGPDGTGCRATLELDGFPKLMVVATQPSPEHQP